MQALTSLASAAGFDLEASVGLEWNRATPMYFARDSFGQLFVYKEKSHNFTGGFSLEYGVTNLLILELPLIGFEYTYRKFFFQSELYEFKLPEYSLDQTFIDQYHRGLEIEAFKELMNEGDKTLPALVRRRFNVAGKGSTKTIKGRFLFFLNREYESGQSKVKVTMRDGEQRIFHRAFKQKGDWVGTDALDGFIDLSDTTIIKENSSRVTVETDENDLSSMTGIIDIGLYDRKLKKKSLLRHIDKLNARFSESVDKPFFRNYVLPDREDVSSYRKLHTHIRVFVNGGKLYERMQTLSEEYFKPFFQKLNRKVLGETSKKGLRKSTFSKFKKWRKKVLKLKDRPKKLTRAFTDFLYLFNVKKYGVEALRQVVGEDQVFVMGEIYGIYPSFSTMQQKEALAGRRFAGKSWGNYLYTPPIRKFLKNNDFAPFSIHIEEGDSFLDILFGKLPKVNGPDPF